MEYIFYNYFHVAYHTISTITRNSKFYFLYMQCHSISIFTRKLSNHGILLLYQITISLQSSYSLFPGILYTNQFLCNPVPFLSYGVCHIHSAYVTVLQVAREMYGYMTVQTMGHKPFTKSQYNLFIVSSKMKLILICFSRNNYADSLYDWIILYNYGLFLRSI